MFVVGLLTLLASCSPAATPTATATEPPKVTAIVPATISIPATMSVPVVEPATAKPDPTATTAPTEQITQLTDDQKAEASALIQTACTVCHSLERVKNKVGDQSKWTVTVDRMVGLGAALTPEQAALVIQYLAENNLK